MCGRSISTYPTIVANKGTEKEFSHRDGDPICDRFLVQMLPERTIAIVADGCNWGNKPKTAAQRASNSFAEYMLAHQHEATTTHYVARLITRAFSVAHHRLVNLINEIFGRVILKFIGLVFWMELMIFGMWELQLYLVDYWFN